jgi:two-component system, cell cycle response regulator
MTTQTSIDIPVKPRVLIADDSRIVRATLIKHIEGMFDFREALDGEQAWETLLVDPSIRVVITDLTMPKLDGYGLLQRIRNSRVGRIRNIPVVVVSGSDEQEERDRAKAAGATDLITKGIGTAQLLSRLDILSRLVTTQQEFERGLEALVREVPAVPADGPCSPEVFETQAEALLAAAVKSTKNFLVLDVCIGLKHVGLEGGAAAPPASVMDAIGRLLRATVRETDCVAKTGAAEFALATGGINFDAARTFAERICRAIAAANLVPDGRMAFIASCGLASLGDDGSNHEGITLAAMREIAHRRAMLGMNRSVTGVIGAVEEETLRNRPADHSALWTSTPAAEAGEHIDTPDLATLLQWIKEGRRDEVLPHIGKLSAELQPLVELVLQTRR